MPDQYIVPEDVIETLEDGRTIQVAAKGSALPLERARELGLLKDKQDAGPAETKQDAPDETKTSKKDK